jgi:hypothetical protein
LVRDLHSRRADEVKLRNEKTNSVALALVTDNLKAGKGEW